MSVEREDRNIALAGDLEAEVMFTDADSSMTIPEIGSSGAEHVVRDLLSKWQLLRKRNRRR